MKDCLFQLPPDKKTAVRTEHPVKHANKAKKEPHVVVGKTWAY